MTNIFAVKMGSKAADEVSKNIIFLSGSKLYSNKFLEIKNEGKGGSFVTVRIVSLGYLAKGNNSFGCVALITSRQYLKNLALS